MCSNKLLQVADCVIFVALHTYLLFSHWLSEPHHQDSITI
ncbi:hypothetical protein A2U01_0109067, partial [Trifolium medium]|nr:hypothetical protein [Trifolium medium]